MDRKHLVSSLRRSATEQHEITPFCPTDEEVAGFVDSTLEGNARVTIERHLPDCQACISRVGLLTRLQREDEAPVSREPVAIRQWAVAATLILAVGLLTWAPQDNPNEFQQTRAVQSQLTPLEILVPSSGLVANREEFVVRWTEVPGSLYYEVRIVSEIGDLLVQQRVDVAEWKIGDAVELQPGQEYFIRVDAHLSESQSIRSEHVPFRLKE